MTVTNLIEYVDMVKPNAYDESVKIKWACEIEGLVKSEIMGLDAGATSSGFGLNTTLCVPEPYSRLYAYYLFAVIDFLSGERDKYMSSVDAFEKAMNMYAKYYLRNRE